MAAQYIDFGYRVNDHQAMNMLDGLDESLSSEALFVFLAVQATQILQEDAKKRFDTEGASDGEAWQSLAKSTIKIRKELGYPPVPINVRSGDLREYVTTSQGDPVPLAEGLVSLQWPDRLPPRSSDLFHSYDTAQHGKSAEFDGDQLIQGDTPPRPVVQVSPAAQALIQDALALHMLDFVIR